MKYFGEYLVSKGLITSEALVDALIEQMTALPSIVEVVRKKGLIETSTLLNLFSIQAEKKVGFKQACVELNLWSSQIQRDIEDELEKRRAPLGSILINRNLIDLPALTRALDDFLSRIDRDPLSSASPTFTPESSDGSAQIDPILVEEVYGHLSEGRLENLKMSFESLQLLLESEKELISKLKDILLEVRALQGMLRLAKLSQTETLVSFFERALYLGVEEVMNQEFRLVPTLALLGVAFAELLRPIRNALQESQTERFWLDQPDIAKKAGEIVSQLKALNLPGKEEKNES